jgi:hypothetical protein
MEGLLVRTAIDTGQAVWGSLRIGNSIFAVRTDRFCVSMILMSFVKVVIAVSVLATMLAMPSRAAEPKLVYRQIGAGYTLALEGGRSDKAFFLCVPDKTFCITATAIGWRKPFIITRVGGVGPGFEYWDTSSKKVGHAPDQSALPSHLKNIPLEPAAVAWQKLSPTRPVW